MSDTLLEYLNTIKRDDCARDAGHILEIAVRFSGLVQMYLWGAGAPYTHYYIGESQRVSSPLEVEITDTTRFGLMRHAAEVGDRLMRVGVPRDASVSVSHVEGCSYVVHV